MKLFKSIYVYLFLCIFAIAAFSRLYLLQSVPPSPSLDEVTIGYNAYSILHTGKDEYGYVFPMLLRAYDDWRPALYVYTVIPFVKIFGLSVLAVRLPSVVMSLITVIVTYFLAVEIFKNFRYKKIIGLFSMFLLSISPWHIYVSRLGHEVNGGVTALALGALCFFIALNNKKNAWVFILASFFFASSFYTYQTEKVFTPIILIILGVCYWRQIWDSKKYFFISFVLGVILTVPIFKESLGPGALIRLQGTSAFSNMNAQYAESARNLLKDRQNRNYVGMILDNRRLVPVDIFLSNYFSHFDPHWLFSNGGNDSFKATNEGLFYTWEFITILFGIFVLLFLTKEKKVKIFLIGWILAAFVAPAITTQAPHAMRAINVLPAPQIIEALGFAYACNFVIKNQAKLYVRFYAYVISFGLAVVVGFGSFYLFLNYFYYFPHQQSESFQYALTGAMQSVAKTQNSYKKIIVSNQDNLYQSYMFYLFTAKYNPTLYLRQGGTGSGGFAQTHSFGKFTFRPINWEKENTTDTLFIGNPKDFPKQDVRAAFYYLDGKEGVVIALK